MGVEILRLGLQEIKLIHIDTPFLEETESSVGGVVVKCDEVCIRNTQFFSYIFFVRFWACGR